MSQLCFFSETTNQAIDGIREGSDPYLGCYSGKTQEELEAQYNTKLEVISYELASKRIENAHLTDPKEITEGDYWYFLEVLPPCRWVRGNGNSSFHMSEYTCGNVTLILVSIGDRYFSYEGLGNSTHQERVDKCMPLFHLPKPADLTSRYAQE